MKRVIYIAAVLGLSVACHPKKHGPFVISGTIENAPGKKIQLIEVPFTSPQAVVLDSAELKDKGEFTLKGRANEEGIYRLAIENGPDVILINDNNNIHVNMDVNDYRNYKVENSPASQSLHELFENYRKDDSTLYQTFKQLDSLQATPGNDSLVTILKAKRDNELATTNNLIKDFVSQSTSPAAIFYALGLGSRTMKQEELKALADASAKRFPDQR